MNPIVRRVPWSICLSVLCLFLSFTAVAADLTALYSRAQLFSDAEFHPNVTIDAYHPEARPGLGADETDREFTLRFQKGADGKVELGYIEETVVYQNGQVRIGLILNHERRLRKAVVLAVTPDLVDTFLGITKKGLITRYTMTSVRQLKYLYKVQKDKAPEVVFLAREVWVLGEELQHKLFSPD